MSFTTSYRGIKVFTLPVNYKPAIFTILAFDFCFRNTDLIINSFIDLHQEHLKNHNRGYTDFSDHNQSTEGCWGVFRSVICRASYHTDVTLSWSISGQLPVVSGQKYPVKFLTTGSPMEQCGLFSFCQWMADTASLLFPVSPSLLSFCLF